MGHGGAGSGEKMRGGLERVRNCLSSWEECVLCVYLRRHGTTIAYAWHRTWQPSPAQPSLSQRTCELVKPFRKRETPDSCPKKSHEITKAMVPHVKVFIEKKDSAYRKIAQIATVTRPCVTVSMGQRVCHVRTFVLLPVTWRPAQARDPVSLALVNRGISKSNLDETDRHPQPETFFFILSSAWGEPRKNQHFLKIRVAGARVLA